MPRNVRASGMVLGGIGGLSPDVSQSKIVELFTEYAQAGIKAFLFPGVLAQDTEKLRSYVLLARRIIKDAGLGKAIIVIGGNAYPAFGLPYFPLVSSPLGLASSRSVPAAERAGFLLGSRLAECGIDLVLGPRLDLASDPKDRAGALDGFGEDSRLAGRLGSAYVRGLSRAGVAACVGRFPGLGTTCWDSYEGMAFIALPIERLESCEMRPFAHAAAAGVEAVLVGRVLVPSLESEHIPASASARVIEGRLREALRFRGLVIGDDIGIDEEPGRAALLGALAGCDLCLFSRPQEACAAAAALDKAMAAGELPAVRVEMAHRRQERQFRPRVKIRISAIDSKARFRRAAHDIEKGISVLRGSLKLGGKGSGDFSSVLVLVFLPPDNAPEVSQSDAVLATLKAELPGAEVFASPADPGTEQTERLVQAIAAHGRFAEAVILTYDAHFRPAQEGLAGLVAESLPQCRVIAMRDPYDAAFFPKAIGLGAAYGFSELCARAVARVLSGKTKARGGCPVEVIGLEV